MNKSESARKWLVHTALSYLGTPYVWGGDDPSGFDCSGFVLECLRSVGIVDEHSDYSADSLLRAFSAQAVEVPTEGALLFALDVEGKATHVVICLDAWFQIGASGGRRTTVDSQSAWRDNAYVRIRPIRYRPDKHRIVLPEY